MKALFSLMTSHGETNKEALWVSSLLSLYLLPWLEKDQKATTTSSLLSYYYYQKTEQQMDKSRISQYSPKRQDKDTDSPPSCTLTFSFLTSVMRKQVYGLRSCICSQTKPSSKHQHNWTFLNHFDHLKPSKVQRKWYLHPNSEDTCSCGSSPLPKGHHCIICI